MIKSSTLRKAMFVLLALIIGSIVIINRTDLPNPVTTIYPVESLGGLSDDDYGLPERQRIELYLRDSGIIETLIVSTMNDLNDNYNVDTWAATEDKNSRIAKLSEGQIYISYQGKTVFSTDDLIYDYIRFNTVCTGLDSRQQLLFSMVRGGSANGEVQDMLFVYIDPVSNTFQHKVIERRYLPDVCDMASAQANEAEQDQLLKDINLVHEKLRPSIGDTRPSEHVTSQQVLPTRQFSNVQLEKILTAFKQFIPVEIEVESETITGNDEFDYQYPNFYEAEFMIEDIAEDANWRIIEVLYLQLYTSWGVLLAENKSTGQWTSFYTVSGGDSKQHLYFDDEVELVNNELRGSFTPYGDHKLAISLNDFTVQSVSKW